MAYPRSEVNVDSLTIIYYLMAELELINGKTGST